MPWFKVDDKLHGHRKTRKALRAAGKRRDSAAMGLWSLAGSWCADNLTDGFVPADELDRWDDDAPALAQRLVDAEYWTPATVDGEPGFRFNNWDEYQPTKAEIEAARKKKADAGRKGGIASGRSRREARGSAGASSKVEPPTRPDPSRPAAAAADTPPPPHSLDVLPEAVEILRGRLEAHKLVVRWDKVTADQLAEIVELIELHGDGPLVKAALAAYRPNSPIMFAQGWLSHWKAIKPKGGLAAVPDPACTKPGHTGTTRHCIQCSAEALAGGDR